MFGVGHSDDSFLQEMRYSHSESRLRAGGNRVLTHTSRVLDPDLVGDPTAGVTLEG